MKAQILQFNTRSVSPSERLPQLVYDELRKLAAAESMRRILVEQLAIHESLEHLAAEDERLAILVKLRCFVGFTLVEAAEALGISRPTAIENWAYAKSRLRILLADSQ